MNRYLSHGQERWWHLETDCIRRANAALTINYELGPCASSFFIRLECGTEKAVQYIGF
jgi:hypothetical protein